MRDFLDTAKMWQVFYMEPLGFSIDKISLNPVNIGVQGQCVVARPWYKG
jgi:hypothetical protein